MQFSACGNNEESPKTAPFFPEHGRYTAAYQSDWSKLPTGDVLARKDLSSIEFEEVKGEAVRKEWRGEKRVEISNLNLRVKWDTPKAEKFGTTLFYIEDAEEVIIENLSIISDDPDYRQYHTIFIEGAERVVIRNLHLAGTVRMYHIRLDGCRDVFIENVEISGIDYMGKGGHRLGGGIWIDNGDDKPGKPALSSKNPKIPGWQIIQNCYFHNNTEDDNSERNQDAVLIHSAGDGLLFNCVVENWLRPAAESSFDLSFRRGEPEFQDRFFRVERNILRNTTFYKCVGNVPGPNVLFYANNLFINSSLADYHQGGARASFLFNTYIFDLEKAPESIRHLAMRGSEGYACLWSYAGKTFLSNSLVFKPSGRFFMFYQNATPPEDKYRFFSTDHNVYALETTDLAWLRTARQGVLFPSFKTWRDSTSNDKKSRLIPGDPALFVDYAGGDYRPKSRTLPPDVVNISEINPRDPRQAVPHDFFGVKRAQQSEIVPGAFCVAPAAND